MFGFRAVLFDLDGTLADSLGDIGGAMNEALAAHGLPQHSKAAYQQFVGEGIEILVRRASGSLDENLIQALIAEYRTCYAARIDVETRPYEGIEQMLDGLVAARVPMAVLSNKRDDFTVELVRRLFARWPFVQVRGEQLGIPKKPDPTVALQIAQALGVPASDCAFVGDTAIDIKTAIAAGMIPIGVLWGFRSREELIRAGAQRLLGHPGELLFEGTHS